MASVSVSNSKLRYLSRINNLIPQLTREYSLDLSGLVLYTEAASGAYLYTPIIGALTGADKVYAITATSRYADRNTVATNTSAVARHFGVADRIQVVFEKREEHFAISDIITNSGFVRPIDSTVVSWLKPTAVIPLMWETWEFREEDLDLSACKKRGILVLGTNESRPPCDMKPYNGFIALKLIFELGFEGYKTKVLLLGNYPSPGGAIYQQLTSLGCCVTWFSSHKKGQKPYSELKHYFKCFGHQYDIIMLAEHEDPVCLLGPEGILPFNEIINRNPNISIGIIAGNVDVEGLKQSGLHYYPDHIQPFGYMSYQPYSLGPRPVLDLYAAGLKVGQVMARARLSGVSLEDAATHALQHSPAMDFEGDRAWI